MEESVSDLSSPRLSENGEEEDVVWQPTVESASSPKRRKRSPRRATKRSQSPKKLHANGLSATEILLDERDDDGTAENTSLGYSHSTSKVGQARETGEVLTMTLTDLARSSRPLQNVVPQLSLGKNIMERCQIPGPEEPAERIERNAMEESAEENEFPDVTYSAEILDFEIKESSRSRSGSMTCRSYANSYSTQSYASSFTHKPHGLIVDGSKTSSKVTATLLARAGFTMELVSSGQACLDKLYPNSGIGSFFDVVFIESDLSDEMGKDIVRQLRDRSYPGMIIGLSQPSGVSELKASGCDEVVTKPVQLGVIMNLFEDKGLLSKGAHKEGDMSVASPQPIRRSHAVGRQ
jgi:CheY-like chemotaxis protein